MSPKPPLELITSPPGLAEMVADAATAPAYAIDTEFNRELTYYPKAALVQVAWRDQLAIIDPLRVSIAPLAELLEGDGLAVLHAATQDLEVLHYECGTRPNRMFDTQIGAGFIGYRTPSLALLHRQMLGVDLPKKARRSNWLRRPLTKSMLAYAAADVERLLEISDILHKELEARGRLEWAEEECALLLRESDNERSNGSGPGDRPPKLDQSLKPAVKLITAWATHHATESDLDPTLLATRSDIEALVRGDPDCRALKGWRAGMIAAPVQKLLKGTAAIALDSRGRLVLEERSRCPISPTTRR